MPRLAAESDPEPPRRLQPQVGEELQAICLACLERDPARRYTSVGALADDLDRWLRGERPRGPQA
jgi:serine/threonine-protein kinase